MRPDFPDMTEPTYILFDGKARARRSKLHRVPVEDFFNSLLEQHAVFEEQQIVVAGARTKWAKRRSIKLSDLLNERWVLPSTDSAGGLHVTEVFRACSLPLPPITVFSTSIQLYNALVARGPFLAMLPSS